MATENRLTVTAEIQRRCTELVLGSEKFNVKLLPLFLESLGCCLSKSEVEEIIASVPKKKFTGNTLPCVTLSKVISRLIKRRMYEPPSYDEVVEVVSKLDVAKTGYLDGKEFVAFIAATMPAFTPGWSKLQVKQRCERLVFGWETIWAIDQSWLFLIPLGLDKVIAATMPAFTPGELEEIRSTVADEDNRVSLVCLKNQMQTPPSAFSIYRYMEELMVNGLDVEDPEEDELSEDSEDVKFGQHGDEDGGDEEPEIGV